MKTSIKRYLFTTLLASACTMNLSAQKDESSALRISIKNGRISFKSAQYTKPRSAFSVFAGYEHFPELGKRNGYDIGVEYKNYMRKKFYFVANFHAGVNDGTKAVAYERDGINYRFDLHNSVRDYMLGIGLGYDFLQVKRHSMYVQATVGLGTNEQYKDGIVLSPSGAYDIVKTFGGVTTRFAISVSAGYDYQLTDWLAVGVNYTGWQIGYEFKSSANLKVGFCF